jgi:hypothetical protein
LASPPTVTTPKAAAALAMAKAWAGGWAAKRGSATFRLISVVRRETELVTE